MILRQVSLCNKLTECNRKIAQQLKSDPEAIICVYAPYRLTTRNSKIVGAFGGTGNHKTLVVYKNENKVAFSNKVIPDGISLSIVLTGAMDPEDRDKINTCLQNGKDPLPLILESCRITQPEHEPLGHT